MVPLTDNIRGALLMTGAMAMFTANDAILKALSGDLPLMQALFLRGLPVTLALVVWARHRGALRIRGLGADGWRLALRTTAEIAAAYFYLTAVFNMPLANVAAIHQAVPLAVTLAAAVVLAEPIGWRRLGAIAVGFAGVLLIVRPGGDGFTVYSLYALGAVAAVVVRDVATRSMTAALPSLTVALATAIGVTGFAGALSLAEPWAPLDGRIVVLLAAAAGFVLLAYILSISAMRVGAVAAVAPFRYTSLLIALVIGAAVFGEWPDRLTLAGAGVVVAAGLFTIFREHAAARAAGRSGRTVSPEARAPLPPRT